jgi:hypothetical protein
MEPRAMVSVGRPDEADASLIEVITEVEAGGCDCPGGPFRVNV